MSRRLLNPLNGPMTIQLLDHLRRLAGEAPMRAVILTGADPSFSAGGDLRGMAATVHPLVDHSPEGATAMWRWIRYGFGALVRLIVHSDGLFVAAINGPAAGRRSPRCSHIEVVASGRSGKSRKDWPPAQRPGRDTAVARPQMVSVNSQTTSR
jgi:hypothetical protein